MTVTEENTKESPSEMAEATRDATIDKTNSLI